MSSGQTPLFVTTRLAAAIGVGVEVRAAPDFTTRERELLEMAQLSHIPSREVWRVIGTNRQLAYATHGIFRFFGKFPPPIARHLVSELSSPGDWILDPMTGSGTTAVEALDLERNVVVRDVSPLSTLLCRVKTTHIPLDASQDALGRVKRRLLPMEKAKLPGPVGLRNARHWFLPETLQTLGKLRAAIEPEADVSVRELLLVAFSSTVRHVSKATTQQGRLFLDVRKAKPDSWPTFSERFEKYSRAVAALPQGRRTSQIRIEQVDAKTVPTTPERFRLAITHPPYFNNYKYSSINALELAWLGFPPKDVRSHEIREFFKVGKPEKVDEYVQDLSTALLAIEKQLAPRGIVALMIGDTTIRDTYIAVTRQLLTAIRNKGSSLHPYRVALRVPRYTEASWVASQRRTGDRLGVTLHDFVLLLSKGA